MKVKTFKHKYDAQEAADMLHEKWEARVERLYVGKGGLNADKDGKAWCVVAKNMVYLREDGYLW